MKLEFSPQVLEKNVSNIKFYEDPSRGRRIVSCGRTDKHDVSDSLFTQILRTRLKVANECQRDSFVTISSFHTRYVAVDISRNSSHCRMEIPYCLYTGLGALYTLSQTERFYCVMSYLTEKRSKLRSFDRQ